MKEKPPPQNNKKVSSAEAFELKHICSVELPKFKAVANAPDKTFISRLFVSKLFLVGLSRFPASEG